MRFFLCRWVPQAVALGFALAAAGAGQARISAPAPAPVNLHPQLSADATPVAFYRQIPAQDFGKLVVNAFENARFSRAGTRKLQDGRVVYTFVRTVTLSQGPRDIRVLVRTDGDVDKHGRCQACFLRLADVLGVDTLRWAPSEEAVTQVPAAERLAAMPWIDQYTLSSVIFPAVDQAYAHIRVAGQRWMNPGSGFNYRPRWEGEKNLYDNAFAGVPRAALKTAIVDAWRAAGFVFQGEEGDAAESSVSTLRFVFPLAPGGSDGVVYKLGLVSQVDASGQCQTCETQDQFDAYQTLPPAGLAGMVDRLTLQSRFSAARAQAYDRLKQATQRYVRPNSTFVVPPAPAPLGSPRPQPLPVAVT